MFRNRLHFKRLGGSVKIELINDGGHEGLANVKFPVVVDSFTSQFFKKDHVFCEVLGSKLIEIGGDPAVIDPYDVYCFHPEVDKSCNLIAPDWLTRDFLIDLSTVVYVGGGTVRRLPDEKLNCLLHSLHFWAMFGGRTDVEEFNKSLGNLVREVVKELKPNGLYIL